MPTLSCKYCNGDHIIKYGKTKSGNQGYFCKDCNRRFSDHREFTRPPRKKKPAKSCQCGGTYYAKGACQTCYRRLRRAEGKDLKVSKEAS